MYTLFLLVTIATGWYSNSFFEFITELNIFCFSSRIYDGIPSWGYVFMFVPLLIGVCLLRSFKVLAILSLIGQVTMTVGLFTIMVYALISAVETKPTIVAVNWIGIPVFFGMVRKRNAR